MFNLSRTFATLTLLGVLTLIFSITSPTAQALEKKSKSRKYSKKYSEKYPSKHPKKTSLSSNPADKGVAQKARYFAWMDILEAPLKSSADAKEVAKALVVGPSRVAAYNIQALGMIYKDKDTKFNDLRKDFKGLEDKIGQFKKWDDILKSSEAKKRSQSILNRHEKNREKALKKLTDFLVDGDWLDKSNSKLDEWKKFIEKFKWDNFKTDRKYVLTQTIEKLETVDDTDWKITELEAENGFHDLRKEFKWFLIYARVLNGAIQFKNSDSCPVDAYKDLPSIKSSTFDKYGKLPGSQYETDPCLISQCLFLASVKLVGDLGKVKDEAEEIFNSTEDGEVMDFLEGDLADKAKSIISEMKNTRVISRLISEIKGCHK